VICLALAARLPMIAAEFNSHNKHVIEE